MVKHEKTLEMESASFMSNDDMSTDFSLFRESHHDILYCYKIDSYIVQESIEDKIRGFVDSNT
jgi:hypothetical protein